MLHVVNCNLVYKILKKSFHLREKVAQQASLIFSVHPLSTEAVCSIVGRADLLWSSMLLISIYINSRMEKSIVSYAVVIAVTASSVLCKEQGIMIPMIILAIQFIQSGLKVKSVLKNSIIYLPFVITILILRLYVMDFKPPKFQEGDNPSAFLESSVLRAVNYQYVYVLNIVIMILPNWLCYDWAMGCIKLISEFSDPRILTIFAMWLTVSLVLVSKKKAVLAPFTMAALSFIPCSNILVIVGFVIAERNLYVPVFGYSIILAYSMVKLKKKSWSPISNNVDAIFIFILVNFSLKSVHRGFEWTTEKTLFESGLKVCPNNAKIHYNMAKISRNNYISEWHYRRSIELWPSYEHALNNLGNLLRNKGQFEEAENCFSKALALNPKFAACHMNLGILQTNLNQFHLAEQSYNEALNLRRGYPDCHFNIGTLYLKMNKKEKAELSFERAIQQDPKHFSAHTNLIILLDEQSKFGRGKEKAERALTIFPNHPDLYFHLANILGKTNQFDKAEVYFLKAIENKPGNANYYANLGVLYHRWKKPEKALKMYEKTLHLDPAHVSARRNLKSLRNTT